MLGLFVLLAFSIVFPLAIFRRRSHHHCYFYFNHDGGGNRMEPLLRLYTLSFSWARYILWAGSLYVWRQCVRFGIFQGGFLPLLLLPLIGLVTGLCSIPLGWIALQTRHYTFIVITIAIFSLMSLLPNLLSGYHHAATTSLFSYSAMGR